MTTDQSPAANESAQTRKLTRKPVLLAAAALIATGGLGLLLGNSMPFAVAQTTPSAGAVPTIETPYGRAPMSFADLVEKVSPAVVSINVKGDVKMAGGDGDMPQIPGMPPGMPGMPGMGLPGMPGMGFPGMGMPGMGLPGMPGMGGAGAGQSAQRVKTLSRTEKNARKNQRKRERAARKKGKGKR